MNIFRVIASGKLGFREEYVSAFLAYLLNPKMDHGLHAEILKRLVSQLGAKTGFQPLVSLGRRLEPRFRSQLDQASDDEVLVDLEVPYEVLDSTRRGYIDIVIKAHECFILIENKISASSTTDDQLVEQYRGFAKRLRPADGNDGLFGKNRPIVSIFLVPAEPSGEGKKALPQFALDEIEKLGLASTDNAQLVTWQQADLDDAVSIIGILRDVLSDDAAGRISPLTYDMGQLIRAFIDFAENDFCGFAYERVTQKKVTGQRLVSDLLESSDNLFVGIQYGIAGLINRAWHNSDFSNELLSVSDQENGWQYLKLTDFQAVARWAMNPSDETAQLLASVQWRGMPFWIRKLYCVSKAAGDSIWIGMRGGIDALEAMSPEQIRSRRGWQIGTAQKGKSSSWFSGTDFCRVLERKGVTFDSAVGSD